MNIDARAFAKEWIATWNSHDMEAILAHYTDDFEITTPMIKIALGQNTGTLIGKTAIRRYWEAALKKLPDLHFELIDAALGVDSVVIYYKSVLNRLAIEVMFFDDDGRVNKVVAHYTDSSQ